MSSVVTILSVVYYGARVVQDIHSGYQLYNKLSIQDAQHLMTLVSTGKTIYDNAVSFAHPMIQALQERAKQKQQLYQEGLEAETMIECETREGKKAIVRICKIPFECREHISDGFVVVDTL